jgi:general secretion pathway protein K
MPVISVLWAMGLLTAVSMSLLWNSYVSYSLVRNHADGAILRAIAEAGVNQAVSRLFGLRPDRDWRANDAQEFEFGGTKIRIEIQDELGKVDLNQADPALLAGLLRSSGLDADAAAGLADKIVDWRTTTELKHLNGAKEAEYRAANSAYRPRNGPFQSVDELLLVMDMTPALLQRIEPAVTVYSGSQFVDPQRASPEALVLLPDTIRNLVASSGSPQPYPVGANDDPTSSLRGRAFTIRVEFEKFVRSYRYDAVVRVTDDPARPYFLLNWRSR